jgi:hypothetical protein
MVETALVNHTVILPNAHDTTRAMNWMQPHALWWRNGRGEFTLHPFRAVARIHAVTRFALLAVTTMCANPFESCSTTLK